MTLQRLARLSLLVLLGILAIFAEAAPVGHPSGGLPSPDLLFLVVAFFSVRRPSTPLMVLVFALGLIRDLLTDAPVGAGALTLFAASEAFRALSRRLRSAPVAAELLAVAVVLAATLAVQWLLVVLTFLQPPAPFVLVRQWALTVALYPLVIVVLRWMFRIGWRRPRRY
ncbi:MAG TPA: rod shape-determining protein MreD [Thermohalobaculum sp.]|nr:rod shape-determining protein MreD [Thermohalobaculum sp.]